MTHTWLHATMHVEKWNNTHMVSVDVGFAVVCVSARDPKGLLKN